MNIEGKLIVKKETQTFGSNGFTKREFVIETLDENYPQKIQIELVQDKCTELDAFNLNENIDVHFNLRGREWVNPQGETKYFNSLQAWRIEGDPIVQPVQKEKKVESLKEEEEDDMPF